MANKNAQRSWGTESDEISSELRQKAARRTGIVAGFLGLFAGLNTLALHIGSSLSQGGYPSRAQVWELLGVGFLVATSAFAFWGLRNRSWSSRVRRNWGVVYLTLVSYPISLTDHSDYFWRDGHSLYGLPYVVLLMLVFPVIVPMRARSALGVALLMAASGPLALLTLSALLGYEEPSGQALLGSFPWLVALLSAALARIVHRLGVKLKAAERLGAYTLLECIGAGSMGAVYRAEHAMLRRATAVKLLPLAKAGATSIARFEKEVRLTAMLSHPNTITVFDYGCTPEGMFYYAMELLNGANLRDIVAVDGPQPPARVVQILSEAAGALAEAHAIHFIHRDIKPSNIMLSECGGKQDVTKVLDFGLVRDLENPDEITATESDLVVGTPLYLAPETLKNPAAIGPGVDIYALGAVGYFLLTGHHVFEGKSMLEVCAAHLYDEPIRPSQRTAEPIPAQLEELVMCCLAKDITDRPHDIASFGRKLRSCPGCGTWTEEDAEAWWTLHRPALIALQREGEKPLLQNGRLVERERTQSL